MNYYDEEITISGPNTKQLSHIKVDRLPNDTGVVNGRVRIGTGGGGSISAASSSRANHNRLSKPSNLMDDDSILENDSLLENIIDHDDEDEDNSDTQNSLHPNSEIKPIPTRRSGTQPPMPTQRSSNSRSGSILPRSKALHEDTDPSETDSDEGAVGLEKLDIKKITESSSKSKEHSNEPPFGIGPEKWETLSISQEIKDLFPFILKYTPQTFETPYHLQPFIPDYIPAVGDVDAFLKVTVPALLNIERQKEMDGHFKEMGLYWLDEPSGEQSNPSLLNMKLRSVLTGSGINPRSASAALIPTAKASKDIDRWVAEVEQVHMAHSTYDAQPRKDIDALLLDWPRAYADADTAAAIQFAYQSCLHEDISLTNYIRVLCERFGVEGPLDTQADYILNVHTLFALYLAANQAWE